MPKSLKDALFDCAVQNKHEFVTLASLPHTEQQIRRIEHCGDCGAHREVIVDEHGTIIDIPVPAALPRILATEKDRYKW